MLSDIRFWLLFIVFLVLAFGIQYLIFKLSDKKGEDTRKEDGIN